ncbi:ProQ/FINO family protein [Acidithiobacillus ferriphilus]|uniref:ProQ/FINO family protein n=1 Tax=Acidithiobacillus ferriphilus TaxID=1689834 RepID=UPI001C066F06|nr:ProQ/FINO family protein [Acidithiobacillus ferriphilus]
MKNLPILTLKKKLAPVQKPAVQSKPTMPREVHALLCSNSDIAPALGRYLPLALRIQRDFRRRVHEAIVQWSTLNKEERRRLEFGILRYHTQRRVYLEAVAAPNSMRHDLDGNPVEPVSEEHRVYARQKLKEREDRKK